ncbi:hypothetical protein PENSPDRAFT_695627 [Peniophora sp. CONT]|nr:hypothetical protein PENSPDRAFT_695627 [Peniophora sp. CONT]
MLLQEQLLNDRVRSLEEANSWLGIRLEIACVERRLAELQRQAVQMELVQARSDLVRVQAELQTSRGAISDVERVFQNLADTLQCSSCLVLCSEAYALPCGHYNCGECLVAWFRQLRAKYEERHPEWDGVHRYSGFYRHMGPQYTCPNCREVMHVGVINPVFQVSAAIAHLADRVPVESHRVPDAVWGEFYS